MANRDTEVSELCQELGITKATLYRYVAPRGAGPPAQIVAQAERIWKKERLRTLRDLDAAALTLRQACALLLDESLDSWWP